jgi:hypothetical protein
MSARKSNGDEKAAEKTKYYIFIIRHSCNEMAVEVRKQIYCDLKVTRRPNVPTYDCKKFE